MILALYLILYTLYLIYSWGFVDASMPISVSFALNNIAYEYRYLAVGFHVFFVIALFALYGIVLYRVYKKKIAIADVRWLIGGCFLLLLAFPAISNDIFNYLATAKVAFLHKENPYLVMPIEIPNESMLMFLHASNKVALYGPVWVAMTFVPHVLGMGNLLMSILTFKSFVALWYIFLLYGVWHLSGKKLWPIVFLGLNPLVIMETFIAGHNDVVMMALAVWAFYFLGQKRVTLSGIVLVFSMLIKYATLFLVPLWIYVFINQVKGRKLSDESVYKMGFWSMMVILFLSPLREEMYPWYYIWPLTFAALLSIKSFEAYISYGFSFGLMFRYAPFLFTREWGGITPVVKKIVTFLPPLFTSGFYVSRKKP